MKDRPPYFAFYPAVFVNDLHVACMTAEQVGCYIMLLCRAWQADPPGTLPNDDRVLAKLAGVDPETWAKIKGGVLAPFKVNAETGHYYSKRLCEEYQAADSRIAKSKNANKQRWQRGNATTDDVALPNSEPSNATASGRAIAIEENRREEKRLNTTPPPTPRSGGVAGRKSKSTNREHPGFDAFWQAYPRREAREKALAAWGKLEPSEELTQTIMAAITRQRQSGCLEPRTTAEGRSTIPLPATWLNGQRWLDEGIDSEPAQPKRANDAQPYDWRNPPSYDPIP